MRKWARTLQFSNLIRWASRVPKQGCRKDLRVSLLFHVKGCSYVVLTWGPPCTLFSPLEEPASGIRTKGWVTMVAMQNWTGQSLCIDDRTGKAVPRQNVVAATSCHPPSHSRLASHATNNSTSNISGTTIRKIPIASSNPSKTRRV